MTGEDKAYRLIRALDSVGKKVVTAESCTGGLLSASLTAVPGSSAVFAGGVITYANTAKENLLGVHRKTLSDHGAVSAETAQEMATGLFSLFEDADFSLSITGIAGPSGGTPEKPAGTVYIGLGQRHALPLAHHFLFEGNRETVRHQTVKAALDFLKERLGG